MPQLMSNTTPDTTERGSALTEILVATLLIAIVVSTAGQTAHSSIATLNALRDQRNAHILTNNMLETLRSVSAASLTNLPAARALPCSASDNCSTNNWLAGKIHTWQTSAPELLPEGRARIETTPDGIQITVSWLSAQNVTLRYSDLYIPA